MTSYRVQKDSLTRGLAGLAFFVLSLTPLACSPPETKTVEIPRPSTTERPMSSGLPQATPVAHIFCGNTDYTRILAYPNGRLYLDGAYTATRGESEKVRVFYSGELETPVNLPRSGLNVLPYSAASVELIMPVLKGQCGTLDGKTQCAFARYGLRIVPEKPGLEPMSVVPELVMTDGESATLPPSSGACRNSTQDLEIRIALTNAFSFQPYTLAPDMIGAIFGKNLAATAQSAPPEILPLPTQLSDVRVDIDGLPAQLFYAAPNQINLLLPANLDWKLPIHSLQVIRGGDRVVGKGTFFVEKATVGLHPSAYYWTAQSHVSLAATGLALAELNQVRFVLNGKTFKPDAALYDWMGPAPGYVGFKQININLKDRLSADELTRPISIQLIGAEDFDLAPSNTIAVAPPN